MKMMVGLASYSNSIPFGVGLFTSTTCSTHHLVPASPNAKPQSTFSLSLTTRTNLHAPISAVNSGLQASIADENENSSSLTNANIVLVSGDENKIQLRVELTSDQTQKVFDKILTNLARTAPPVPGFRMQKGGRQSLSTGECNRTSIDHYHLCFSFLEDDLVRKSIQIPKSFLIQMLGEERVTKFVIQEILNSTMADYARKENLDVKDRKISTTQSVEELKQSFTPGNEFGFNVIIEPENS